MARNENGIGKIPELEDVNGFTPTDLRLLAEFGDGNEGRTVGDLMPCLDDDLSSKNALEAAISKLRKKLRARGLDILCTVPGGTRARQYRMVRLLASPYND